MKWNECRRNVSEEPSTEMKAFLENALPLRDNSSYDISIAWKPHIMGPENIDYDSFDLLHSLHIAQSHYAKDPRHINIFINLLFTFSQPNKEFIALKNNMESRLVFKLQPSRGRKAILTKNNKAITRKFPRYPSSSLTSPPFRQ